ncbi:hypothetical protein HYS28_01405 [Candidatus Uhrbacteria bacterium]|nr:hypothetical protein [Candidatus Uhrbacteria bacterium]
MDFHFAVLMQRLEAVQRDMPVVMAAVRNETIRVASDPMLAWYGEKMVYTGFLIMGLCLVFSEAIAEAVHPRPPPRPRPRTSLISLVPPPPPSGGDGEDAPREEEPDPSVRNTLPGDRPLPARLGLASASADLGSPPDPPSVPRSVRRMMGLDDILGAPREDDPFAAMRGPGYQSAFDPPSPVLVSENAEDVPTPSQLPRATSPTADHEEDLMGGHGGGADDQESTEDLGADDQGSGDGNEDAPAEEPGLVPPTAGEFLALSGFGKVEDDFFNSEVGTVGPVDPSRQPGRMPRPSTEEEES